MFRMSRLFGLLTQGRRGWGGQRWQIAINNTTLSSTLSTQQASWCGGDSPGQGGVAPCISFHPRPRWPASATWTCWRRSWCSGCATTERHTFSKMEHLAILAKKLWLFSRRQRSLWWTGRATSPILTRSRISGWSWRLSWRRTWTSLHFPCWSERSRSCGSPCRGPCCWSWPTPCRPGSRSVSKTAARWQNTSLLLVRRIYYCPVCKPKLKKRDTSSKKF